MNKKTLKALKGSIKKWEMIVRSTKSADRGVENCPLCQLFIQNNCHKCPVGNSCNDTPYEEWIDHHERVVHLTQEFITRTDRMNNFHREPYCKECLRTARAEVEFLKSLLPEGNANKS